MNAVAEKRKGFPWRHVVAGAWVLLFVRFWMAGAPFLMVAFWGLGGGAVLFFVFPAIGRWFGRLEQQGADSRMQKMRGGHVRGTELYSQQQLRYFLAATAKGHTGIERDRAAFRMHQGDKGHPHDDSVFPGWLKIAGTPIPPAVENLHFAIAASTGAGKSVTLRGLLADIRRRGDRAIVIDNGGEFMRDFGHEDDLVLSPFDSRSQGWNVANEVRAPHDWARLARSVVPDGHGSDKSWHEMAQALFANIGTAVGDGMDNAQLLEIATSYSAKMLEPILAGTSSAILTQEGGERLLTNIRSVYGTTLASWSYMKGGVFSLRDYMQASDSRWLFVPFQESEFGVSRSLIAAWMDILVSAGLERAEGGQQTWVILDELDTLGKLSSLIAATTKLRKRRVSIVSAFQSYSQLEANYGSENATTLLNCFSSKIILRSVDGKTADQLSKELGERETWKRSISSTGQGHSESRSQQMERLVLASEIQSLPDLHGYIKLAGEYPVAKCVASIDAGRL
jgi:Type IV secretion-system coupling protein DNA-binding domain